LSKTSVNGVSALASRVVGSNPPVAAPTGAVTVTVGAFGSTEAAGAPELPAPPPPDSAVR
jgi:hypothetical protein